MKKLVLGIIIVTLLAGTGVAAAFSNSGFEDPVLDPGVFWSTFPDGTPGLVWTVEQGLGADPAITPTLEIQKQGAFSSPPGLAADEGNQFAELDSYANVNISQMIPTTAGKTYSISFAQACRNDGGENPSVLRVYWGDTYLSQTSCAQTMTWVTHSYSTTASSTGLAKLMFVDEGPSNSYGVLLDHVIVEEMDSTVPIPEFPMVALPVALVVGLVGAVLFIKSTKEN